MRRKIAVIASSRATYGYKRKVIGLINTSSRLELQLIVTGLHLVREQGYSIQEIERDGYPIVARVDMMIRGDRPSAWAKSIGVEIENLAQVFDMLKPDMTLVTGDRAEMLAAAVTSAYMNIPVAHIQAGDISGHIDGSARHAITKLSHLHFASCQDSAKRVERLGEEPWRIFNVGAPQLDTIVHDPKISKEDLEKKLNLRLKPPTLLVIQHPVLVEFDDAYSQMKETLEAVVALKLQAIVIYPNLDAGGMETVRAIKEYERYPFIHTRNNLEREVFIKLFTQAAAIAGNSSSGILEAPSFKRPAINIGNRQRGRMQASNVINVPHDKNRIVEAIQKALYDEEFKGNLVHCVNPYGDGKSSERIVKILEEVEISKKLLDKEMAY